MDSIFANQRVQQENAHTVAALQLTFRGINLRASTLPYASLL